MRNYLCSGIALLAAITMVNTVACSAEESPLVTFDSGTAPHLAFPEAELAVGLAERLTGDDYKLAYVIKDHQGLSRGDGEESLGAGVTRHIKAPARKGAFVIDYTLTQGDCIVGVGEYRLAVIAPRELPESFSLESPFGNCVTSDFNRITSASPFDPPTDFTLAHFSGIRWGRPILLWQSIEPSEGVYNWEQTDALLQQRRDAKIAVSPFVVISQAPSWVKIDSTADDPSEGQAKVRRYVHDLVARYKDSVKYWTIDNELNHAPGHPTWTPELYVGALKAAYAGAKEADPEAQILICGVAYMDLEWIEEVYQAGGKDAFDIMNIHPYCFPAPPESKQGSQFQYLTSGARASYALFDELRDVMAKYGDEKKRVWITELSWSDGKERLDSVTDRMRYFVNTASEQASYIVRAHVLALAWGVEKVFLLCLPDIPSIAQEGPFDERMGMVSLAREPKLSYVAYANMTARLEGARFVKSLETARPTQYGYVFDKAGQSVTVLWDTEVPSLVSLRTDAPAVDIVDMCGNSEKRGATEGVVQLVPITAEPIYVVGGTEVEYVEAALPQQ